MFYLIEMLFVAIEGENQPVCRLDGFRVNTDMLKHSPRLLLYVGQQHANSDG